MFEILTIPFDPGAKGFDCGVLNRFVLNKRVIAYRAEFFQDGGTPCWTIFIEYDPLIDKTSEKETLGLDEGQRLFLDRLRAWRKARAEKDGVPVFIIGTNRELVEIVKTAPKTLEALKTVKGFGKGKIAKYGKEIVEIASAFYAKT